VRLPARPAGRLANGLFFISELGKEITPGWVERSTIMQIAILKLLNVSRVRAEKK
jgi:predicted XRE-type DNA-binding protein